MPKLTMSSLGFRIDVTSKRKEHINYILKNKAVFESIVVELELKAINKTPNLTIGIVDNRKEMIETDLEKGVVRLNVKLFDRILHGDSPFDFVFFVVVLFEYLYEKNGIYGLWCAGFVHKTKASLLFANSNSGKSNLVTRLSHEIGYNIVGDDRVALALRGGKPQVIGGNSMLSFRSGAVPGYLASIPDLIKDKKLRAKPEQIGAIKFKGSAPLSSIFIVSISEKNSFGKIPQGEVARYVYSNISRVIGASEFSFMDSFCGLPYIDSTSLRARRFKFVSTLKKIEAYEVHGTIDYMVKKISETVALSCLIPL